MALEQGTPQPRRRPRAPIEDEMDDYRDMRGGMPDIGGVMEELARQLGLEPLRMEMSPEQGGSRWTDKSPEWWEAQRELNRRAKIGEQVTQEGGHLPDFWGRNGPGLETPRGSTPPDMWEPWAPSLEDIPTGPNLNFSPNLMEGTVPWERPIQPWYVPSWGGGGFTEEGAQDLHGLPLDDTTRQWGNQDIHENWPSSNFQSILDYAQANPQSVLSPNTGILQQVNQTINPVSWVQQAMQQGAEPDVGPEWGAAGGLSLLDLLPLILRAAPI